MKRRCTFNAGAVLLLLFCLPVLGGCGDSGSTAQNYYTDDNSPAATLYSVSGRLTDANGVSAVGGATCTLSSEAGSSRYTGTSVTDADGNYRFTGVPAGNYVFQASAANYVTINKYFTVSGDTTSMSATLPSVAAWDSFMGDSAHPCDGASGYLYLEICDSGGNLLPGVTAELSPASYASKGYRRAGGSGFDWQASSTTSAGGVLFYKVMPGQSFSLTASKSGYTFSPMAGFTVTAGQVTCLTMTGTGSGVSSCTLSGTIRDHLTLTELQGVTCTLAGQGVSGTTVTNSNGYYCFSSLPAGSYTIKFALAGYISSQGIFEVHRNRFYSLDLAKPEEWNALMGDSAHPYDPSSGYLFITFVSGPTHTAVEGVSVTAAPADCRAIGYWKESADNVMFVDWGGQATTSCGEALLYGVNPGQPYTITGTVNGSPVYSLPMVTPTAGEMIFIDAVISQNAAQAQP
ncbi:MAG: collagen binding domain-containing protein [Candidatus Xenobiia bacterium LiM19]